jgi:hypothetical protein
MHSDPNLPQTPSGFSREPGLVPASNLTDDCEFRLGLKVALDQIILNRGRAKRVGAQ